MAREWPSVVALLVLAATMALVLTTAALSPLKDDVAWLLYVARQWLGGQRLYEDLVEVNPPLIIWLYTIPAGIAQSLDVAPKLVAIPFFAGLMLGAAWWTSSLLHRRAAMFNRRTPAFAIIATVLLVMPGVEFGQREHLLAAAVLPYIALFALELDNQRTSRWMAVAVGVVAGLGCALKPSYGVAFVLVEAVGALRGHRLLRTSSVSVALTGLLYAAAVLVFCPAFLEKAVPLALALYGGTDTPSWQILRDSHTLLFGLVALSLACWSMRDLLSARSPFLRHLLLALAAFAIGATIVFVLQGKNWFYHRLPATITTTLGLLLWLGLLVGWRDFPRRRLVLALPLVLLALLDFTLSTYDRMRPWVESAASPNLSTEVKLERLVKREKARTYIAFSEWIALGFPVVNDTGVTWASRFDSMWALKGEMWRARQDGAAPQDFPIRQWVARDFVANCPDLAVVDSRGGMNFVGVLISSDPDFARAWAGYSEIAAFDGLRVLRRGKMGCALEHEAIQPHTTGTQPSGGAMEQP